MDPDTVSFKVAVINNNGKSEMRYLSMPKGIESEYKYLCHMLNQTFPILENKKYYITWIDNEKDSITISSDAELEFAAHMMGDVKKINVIIEGDTEVDKKLKSGDDLQDLSGDRKRDHTGRNGKFHYNVVCDVCDGYVYGFRYKCLTCYDFDLCQKCEHKHNHNNHFMIRIPVAVKDLNCDTQGSPLGNWLQENSSKIQSEAEPPFSKKHRKDSKGDRHHMRRGCGGRRIKTIDGAELFKTFSTYINDFTNLVGDINLTKETAPGSNAAPNSDEGAQTSQNEPAPSTSGNFSENVNVNVNSLCKLIGNVIDNVLAPQGIEVVDVHLDTKDKPCPYAQSTTENNTDSEKSSQKNVQTENNSNENMEPRDTEMPSTSSTEGNVDSVAPAFTPRFLGPPIRVEEMDSTKSTEELLSDADSESSDCIVITSTSPVDNAYGWTILNSDENELSQKLLDLQAEKKSNDDMEVVTDNFQKKLEVSKEAQSSKTLINTEVQTTEEERRFVLIPDPATPSNPAPPSSIASSAASTQPDQSYQVFSNNNIAPLNPQPAFIVPPPHLPFVNPPPVCYFPPPIVPVSFPQQVSFPSSFSSSVASDHTYPPLNVQHIANNQSAQPSQPAQLFQPAQPFEQAQPFQPLQPPQPAQPSRPLQPPQPAQPSQTVQPPQPARPSQQPRSPQQPPRAPENTTTHPNGTPLPPHISTVLSQLLSMGYTNEDGWLTLLISMHDGNINKVLDFLSSVNRSS